jgi:hypothetical protein
MTLHDKNTRRIYNKIEFEFNRLYKIMSSSMPNNFKDRTKLYIRLKYYVNILERLSKEVEEIKQCK